MRTARVISKCLCLLTISLGLSGCLEEAQTLSSEPSLLDQDTTRPSCPGLSSVTVTSGPSLTLSWVEASDNYSQASAITYKIFVRKNSDSYDLVSPAKIVVGATSTLISSGVAAGNTYTLFVQCSDEKGNEYPTGPLNEQSITVTDSLPPSQITNLAAGSATHTTLLLTWSPSDDGAGGTTAGSMRYKVYYSLTSPVATSGAPLATVLNGGTSYAHTGLNPATTYYYKVVAVDTSNNESTPSNEASGTTLTDSSVPTFAGNTASISVTGTTTSSVSLSWSAATDDVTPTGSLSYRIYRCPGSTTCDPFSGTLVTTVTSGTTTYPDTGLSASTVYVYGIRAVDSSNNVSTNTDVKITSTTYSNSGSRYVYPTIDEVNIRFGISAAVANVVGAATGASAYPDLLVGAPNASEAGAALRFTGCVYVFAGTGVGTFSTTPTGMFCQPNAIASGTQNGLNFGSAIAIGDVDADGLGDVVVSAPLRAAVYIYRTQNNAGTLSIGTTAIPVTHPSANTTFGTGLCIGNSDNTGADDLFIITTSENCNTACGGVTGTGNILVFNNSSTPGLFIAPSTVSYRISPTHSLQASGYTIANNEVVARSCTIGRFDPSNSTQLQLVVGSGTVSYAAGAGNDGMVAFYRKTAANTFNYQNVLPATTPSVTGTQWGNAVSRIQLSTGTDELVVGAPNDSNVGNIAGAAYIYTVSTSPSNFVLTDTTESYYGGSDFDNNAAGSALAVGDIWGHGDGSEDLVMGAYLDDGTLTVGANSINIGQVFTYRNVSGTVSSTVRQGSFDTSPMRVKNDNLFGQALCKGDVNNDGITDIMIGSPNSDYDTNASVQGTDLGSVYIYYGVTAGEIDFDNPSQILYAPGSQGGGRFGYSCVVMDYNADGQNDLVIGSPYRDVVQTDRGVVYVYYGQSNSALPSASSTSLNSPLATASVLFGWALTKGDFDNNGYEDLAVSMPGYTGAATASGRVYVFWSDVTTHAISSANYTAIDPPNGAYLSGGNPYLTNTQAVNNNYNFGRSMQSFRTVNGSAGVDLVICSLAADTGANYYYSGSPAAADIGNCWIFEGKVNGSLVGNYQIMTTPKNEIRYPTGFSTPANSILFGAGITKADWNADGTDDLLICAARQQNLITFDANAGGCFAYFGLSSGGFNQFNGYNSNAGGTRFVPQPDDYFYNPNAEPSSASRFGESILMLDVNNNTSLDLIIGEPYSDNPGGPTDLGADAGRVYLIRGGY